MDKQKLTKEQLAGMLDHTFLQAYAQTADFEKLCREAKEHHFAMVAVNSEPVALCKRLLVGCKVHVGAAISFPLGQTTIQVKVFETKKAIEDGADEIDYVLHIGKLKAGDDGYIKAEMEEMVALCRRQKVLSKVIFENGYLTREEITRAAMIARAVRPDFIKTSTGFGITGALQEDVALMKQTVGNDVKVKAAGGIRDWETCKKMMAAGAERIGTSQSIAILEGFAKEEMEGNKSHELNK